jgi:hypothetical protein
MDWNKISTPFWLGEGQLKRYVEFLETWYAYIKTVLEWPLRQYDVDTADLFVVDLLAWERGVDRFKSEPEWLYRRRVKFAYQNALDAGTPQGLTAIWDRMGLGYLEIEERMTGRDWDVVNLTMSDQALADNPELIDTLLQSYARTCRRYEATTVAKIVFHFRVNSFGNTAEQLVAKIDFNPSAIVESDPLETHTFSDFTIAIETLAFADFEVA